MNVEKSNTNSNTSSNTVTVSVTLLQFENILPQRLKVTSFYIKKCNSGSRIKLNVII